MKEGQLTLGLWGPLALADILATLTALLRLQIRKEDQHKCPVPTRAETLKSWCLPFTAAAFERLEENNKARALFDAVKQMADKQHVSE